MTVAELSHQTHALNDAYVLHRRPYRETSLLVDFLTFDQGIIRGVVRGVHTKKNNKSALLQPFSKLAVDFVHKGELASIKHIETIHSKVILPSTFLYCGLYLNELLLRLFVQRDPLPDIFAAYETTLSHLAQAAHRPADEGLVMQQVILREFELYVLAFLGYLPELTVQAHDGLPVAENVNYCFHPQRGIELSHVISQSRTCFSGKVILAVAQQHWDQDSLPVAKYICRHAIAAVIGDKPLKSRELFAQQGIL